MHFESYVCVCLCLDETVCFHMCHYVFLCVSFCVSGFCFFVSVFLCVSENMYLYLSVYVCIFVCMSILIYVYTENTPAGSAGEGETTC